MAKVLFSLEFASGEVDIERAHDNPSQWLKLPDPLLESAKHSGSVSTFLLLARLEVVFLK